MITDVNSNLVVQSLTFLNNSIQDYTNSIYINTDQRERIMRLQNEIRDHVLLSLKDDQLKSNQRDSTINNSSNNNDDSNQQQPQQSKFNRLFDYSTILSDCEILKKLLQSQTMQLANSLFRENKDASLLNYIKTYALSNHYDLLMETLDKFREYSEQVLEVCCLKIYIHLF